jgi:hypothetical protein
MLHHEHPNSISKTLHFKQPHYRQSSGQHPFQTADIIRHQYLVGNRQAQSNTIQKVLVNLLWKHEEHAKSR